MCLMDVTLFLRECRISRLCFNIFMKNMKYYGGDHSESYTYKTWKNDAL